MELIDRAHRIVDESVVAHEREDETIIYPRLMKALADSHGLSAMSRAHREILHLARLLARLAYGLRAEDADKYLVRDAQRAIELIEALVRIHNAQKKTSMSMPLMGGGRSYVSAKLARRRRFLLTECLLMAQWGPRGLLMNSLTE